MTNPYWSMTPQTHPLALNFYSFYHLKYLKVIFSTTLLFWVIFLIHNLSHNVVHERDMVSYDFKANTRKLNFFWAKMPNFAYCMGLFGLHRILNSIGNPKAHWGVGGGSGSGIHILSNTH